MQSGRENTRPPAARRAWALAAATMLAATLAGCGGGGGGDPVGTPPGSGGPTTPPGGTVTDVQTLPAARAGVDMVSGVWRLMADVQNIIVVAPVDTLGGSRTVACGEGGSLEMLVLQNSAQPYLIHYRTRFDNCRFSGLLLQGTQEVTSTRSVNESAERPWAGTVRFENYSIESASRRSEYHGLVTASGAVNGGGNSLVQPFRATLSNFSMRSTGDALGRGTRFTTPSFQVERLGVGPRAVPLYDMAGVWNLQAGAWSAVLDVAAGSRIALLENEGSERFSARLQWAGDTLPDFQAALSLLPVGATSLRVALDFDGDGSADRSATYERSTDLGLRL